MPSTITKDELFRAVLALDVYHRGYNGGLGLTASGQIGNATIGQSSADAALIGLGGTGLTHESIGFYALEYTLADGTKIIAYRGTDDDFATGAASDSKNGFGIGAGSPDGPQARAAIEFYKSIAGSDRFAANIQLTGQSLGGGLAGYVASIYNKDAVLFSNMAFESAAQSAYEFATTGSASINFTDAYNALNAIIPYPLPSVFDGLNQTSSQADIMPIPLPPATLDRSLVV